MNLEEETLVLEKGEGEALELVSGKPAVGSEMEAFCEPTSFANTCRCF